MLISLVWTHHYILTPVLFEDEVEEYDYEDEAAEEDEEDEY